MMRKCVVHRKGESPQRCLEASMDCASSRCLALSPRNEKAAPEGGSNIQLAEPALPQALDQKLCLRPMS